MTSFSENINSLEDIFIKYSEIDNISADISSYLEELNYDISSEYGDFVIELSIQTKNYAICMENNDYESISSVAIQAAFSDYSCRDYYQGNNIAKDLDKSLIGLIDNAGFMYDEYFDKFSVNIDNVDSIFKLLKRIYLNILSDNKFIIKYLKGV